MSEPSLNNLMDRLNEAKLKEGQLPPVNDWHPTKKYRINIRIDREGRWYYQDSEIKRHSMVKLFASILRKDDDKYYLVTPQEKLLIKVDAYPLVATEVNVADGKLVFSINTGEMVVAGEEHPIEVAEIEGEPRPSIQVRDRLDALIHRNVFYRLVDISEERTVDGALHLTVSSQGKEFDLGVVK